MGRLFSALTLAALAAAAFPSSVRAAGAPRVADAEEGAKEADGTRLVFELSAGPLSGLDEALRGGSAGLLLGAGRGAIELGLRPSIAYDHSLGSASLRADLVLGVGDGVRLIAGGIIPLQPAVLEPEGAALPLEAGPWPCRFGLESKLFESRRGPFGSALSASAAIAYSAYRVAGDAALSPQAALAGTAAFAACVELRVSIDLSWRVPVARRARGGTP